MSTHGRALEAALEAVPSLRDAVLLLKVWARQNSLDGTAVGLSGFLLVALAAHLAQTGVLVSP